MKKLEDYIHLYIGQLVQTPTRHYSADGGKSIKMVGRIMNIDLVIKQAGIHFKGNNECDLEQYPFDTLKLILRPYNTLYYKERMEIQELGNACEGIMEGLAIQALEMIKRGYDIFHLKQAGLAVYESEIA